MASKRHTEERTRKNERNEYIPSFISQKPFYVSDDTTDADYLEHQRLHQTSKTDDSKWYGRGKKSAPAATKWRKGACENCGAMTHKAKDCLERPRKKGAKWTGKDIQADEVIEDVNLSWDAKRDRWNGFDGLDFERSMMEKEEKRKQLEEDDGEGGGVEGEEDEGDRYEAETDMGRKQPTSTRNLRIREDTAKYLLNLDLESARYDPKTRSMVDAGIKGDKSADLVSEEGFLKASGDAGEFERSQQYAWEAQQQGRASKMHLQANPTASIFAQKQQKVDAEAKKSAQKKALLELYGQQDDVRKKDSSKGAVVEESERFVEYDAKGRIKNRVPVKAKSVYPEDVLINNHTSVWGSWWSDFKWGYFCCHSFVRNSYCTGDYGKQALEEAEKLIDAEQVPKEIAWQDEEQNEEHVPNGTEDDAKMKADVAARKRKFEQLRDGGDEAEMDEYRRKKMADGDPMAGHLGKDELLS